MRGFGLKNKSSEDSLPLVCSWQRNKPSNHFTRSSCWRRTGWSGWSTSWLRSCALEEVYFWPQFSFTCCRRYKKVFTLDWIKIKWKRRWMHSIVDAYLFEVILNRMTESQVVQRLWTSLFGKETKNCIDSSVTFWLTRKYYRNQINKPHFSLHCRSLVPNQVKWGLRVRHY